MSNARDTTATRTLYRPVGFNELRLIHESGMTAFYPRLPDQPIFYPVLNRDYARQIARDWNARDAFSGNIGFVLEFAVSSQYLDKFETQIVGGKEHAEIWVPADDLTDFNRQIVGGIRVLEFFRGEACDIEIDENRKMPAAWGDHP